MAMETEPEQASPTLRQKIVLAAAALLEEEGLEALSTRAVAARAGVPAPSIFRLFGDKDGLLDQVAQHGFGRYLGEKAELLLLTADDPVQTLSDGWDLHIDFGLEHPAYYALVYGQVRPGYMPQAGRMAAAHLAHMMTMVAAVGRLRMSVKRATELMHSAGVGTVLTLTALPEDVRDIRTSHAVRDMVVKTITLPAEDQSEDTTASDGIAATSMSLLAALDQDGAAVLTPGEHGLLREWLNRLADGTGGDR
ncbi:TetR/AcrR family transcriptional regulator [Streptomyces sp. NPDC002463]|uniref:TetR/AcrR family transcriptional regulator n=1 Tax=Streptomyces sp. NPDC002463 TaxID=3364645 RepID=UPI0036A64DBA